MHLALKWHCKDKIICLFLMLNSLTYLKLRHTRWFLPPLDCVESFRPVCFVPTPLQDLLILVFMAIVLLLLLIRTLSRVAFLCPLSLSLPQFPPPNFPCIFLLPLSRAKIQFILFLFQRKKLKVSLEVSVVAKYF